MTVLDSFAGIAVMFRIQREKVKTVRVFNIIGETRGTLFSPRRTTTDQSK
jgi:hypothetical protein